MDNLFHIENPKLTRTVLIKIELRKNYSGGLLPRGLYTTLAVQYGCTRQRIEQIANRLFPDRIKRNDDRLKHECKVCETLVYSTSLFCSRGHYIDYRHSLPVVMCGNCGERPKLSLGLCARCYQLYRYHVVEGVKEKHRVSYSKYMDRPEIKLKVREQQKKYIKIYQQSPKGKARAQEYYDRRREDPVRWAEFLERSREYQKKKYREKKELSNE